MATLTKAHIQNQLIPGLWAIGGREYDNFEGSNQHLDIYGTAETGSTKGFEEMAMESQFGMAELKVEGGVIPQLDPGSERYKQRITFDTWGGMFAITREAISDNQYQPIAKVKVRGLSRALAYRKQIQAITPLVNAFSGSFLQGDGVALCSTARPLESGGTNSNRLTVDSQFNEAAMESGIIQVKKWVDHKGLKISAMPKKVILPVNYMFIAERIMKSAQQVGTANNDANIHRNFAYVPGGYSINNYLPDNAWFMTTSVANGMTFFQRWKLEPLHEGAEGSKDFTTTNLRFGMMERYGFGCFDPLGIFGSPGA